MFPCFQRTILCIIFEKDPVNHWWLCVFPLLKRRRRFLCGPLQCPCSRPFGQHRPWDPDGHHGAAALWHVHGGRRASAVAAVLSDAKLGVPSRLVKSCAGDLLYEEPSKVDEAAIVVTLCILGCHTQLWVGYVPMPTEGQVPESSRGILPHDHLVGDSDCHGLDPFWGGVFCDPRSAILASSSYPISCPRDARSLHFCASFAVKVAKPLGRETACWSYCKWDTGHAKHLKLLPSRLDACQGTLEPPWKNISFIRFLGCHFVSPSGMQQSWTRIL